MGGGSFDAAFVDGPLSQPVRRTILGLAEWFGLILGLT